jgi:hypothetical protein
LDCFSGSVPGKEKALFGSLVSSVPEENIVIFEEPDIVELPPTPPKAPKRKGRAKKTATQASSHFVTRFASKTPLSHPPFHGVHLSFHPLLLRVPPLVLLRPLVLNLLLIFFIVAFLLGGNDRREGYVLLDTSDTSFEAPNTFAFKKKWT